MSQKVLSVLEFVSALKSLVTNHAAFKNVAVVGEISNFNAHQSGHFYFSLKDKDSRISCVMFRSKASNVLFKPKNGDKVVLMGYADVFESNGSVQLYVDRMNLDGLGDLHIQYEALKKEYLEKGYFDPTHKKILPLFPKRIGVICGHDSAAYADISKTLRERWPMAEQVDFLAYVQGQNAVASLVERIHEAEGLNLDCLILARGGGSIEDLWAFNERAVVEAVYNSNLVIVSGVGHESDTTLVDFVSDYRAATPTAAAVALTPHQDEIKQALRDYMNRYYVSVRNKIRKDESLRNEILSQSYLSDPKRYIDLIQQKLDYNQSRILSQITLFDKTKDYLGDYVSSMQRLLTQKITQHNQGLWIMDTRRENALRETQSLYKNQVTQNQMRLELGLKALDKKIEDTTRQIITLDKTFERALERHIALKTRSFNDIIKSLDLLSPLKIMGRGYGLIYHDDVLVKSVSQVEIGQNIEIKLQDGSLISRVEKRKDNE